MLDFAERGIQTRISSLRVVVARMIEKLFQKGVDLLVTLRRIFFRQKRSNGFAVVVMRHGSTSAGDHSGFVVKESAPMQTEQRRDQFSVGEIPECAENDNSIRDRADLHAETAAPPVLTGQIHFKLLLQKQENSRRHVFIRAGGIFSAREEG